MLPSERNERLLWRISLALIILMALVVVVWLVRFVSFRAHRLMQQRNVPVDEGRAHLTETV